MSEIIPLVNSLLDRIREEQHISSDEKLAHLLGVSDQAIYRWRRGQFGGAKVAIVLLPLVLKHADHLRLNP